MAVDNSIVDVLAVPSYVTRRTGLEAGTLSEWLYAGLVDAGQPAICVETRHIHAALSAQINKTDRNDALGITQMMRVGLYKAVHVKTPASQPEYSISQGHDPAIQRCGRGGSGGEITIQPCLTSVARIWRYRCGGIPNSFRNQREK